MVNPNMPKASISTILATQGCNFMIASVIFNAIDALPFGATEKASGSQGPATTAKTQESPIDYAALSEGQMLKGCAAVAATRAEWAQDLPDQPVGFHTWMPG